MTANEAARFFARHCAEMRWQLLDVLGSARQAEEALPNVWIKLRGIRMTVRNEVALAKMIARTVGIDWLRRQECEARATQAWKAIAREVPELYDPVAEAEAAVQHALTVVLPQALSQRKQSIFVMRKVYGFTSRQIGEHLRITENTVENHLRKAHERLFNALGGDPPYRLAPRIRRGDIQPTAHKRKAS